MKSGLLMGETGGKSTTGLWTANRCFFLCRGKTCRTISDVFPGKAIGIAAVMDMSSGYGGSEDNRVRDRDVISVIGSPNGLESMTGSQLIALPPALCRAINWFSVGTWSGISKKEALKNWEEIMVTCFKVAGGMPEFQFPEPTTRKIGPFMRKSVFL